LQLKSALPPRFGVLGVVGALALTTACVSGALVDPKQDDVGAAPGSGGEGQTGQPAGSAGNGTGSGTGSGSGTSNPPGGVPSEPAPTALPPESACSTPGSPGPRIVRRLTAGEFAASIADLFGDKTAPVAQVFNDSRVLGFAVDSNTLRVQDLNADQLMTNAEAVASWAVTSKMSQLTQLSTCSTKDTNCAKLFIKNFGRKAFRTAIPDNDPRIKAYSDLFVGESSFADGAAAVIAAMLQSPYFLYRSEIGAPGASGSTIRLTPYEVASSLSYLLTGSAPDDTLLKAADAVQSGDAAAVSKMVDDQAARLLAPSGADPLSAPAQEALMNFMSGWLGLDRLYTNVKDDAVLKLTNEQRADMATETKKLILDIWGGSTNNTVGDLFSANYTFLNQNLASYYGLETSGLSTAFSKVTLPSDRRDSGILAHASILVGYARSNLSSPTQRGHLVRSRILCQDVPPPPPGIDTKFTPSADLKTTREQYLQGHAAPDHQPCYGCHRVMDPIGVAFEHYDAFGRYRTTENGETIDATGTIYSANQTDGDVAINGLSGDQGMQAYLAKSEDVKQCLVRYWSYYAFGVASWPQDGCTYDAIRAESASKSNSLKSVLSAIIHSPRFTTRVADQ
jgi:uncharacterized protein DUF1588/uncharacterized protein DUF1592/uncharacterized protein DUF1595/uncharacterized protein DUF1587/uncharacterized protein DUF1585